MTSLHSKLLGSLAVTAIAAATGCHPTSHPMIPSTLGVSRASSELEAVLDTPGPVAVESVVAADWEVPREGLINLDSPQAKAAGLKDGPEPIQVLFHAIRHPTRGLFIVDTGIERDLWAQPEKAAIRGDVAAFMNLDKMKIHVDTATWLARQSQPLAGVFLTHLHLDHVSGMRDVPNGTPIYAGPGEADESAVLNVLVQPVIDRALEGKTAIQELPFQADRDGRFAGVLDLFGDRTVWAVHVPGHTPGSTAYVVRTPKGPVLLTGDACHTAWGWQNGVEPGTFSADKPTSKASLERLRAFVQRHPTLDVRLGHQSLPAPRRTEVAAK